MVLQAKGEPMINAKNVEDLIKDARKKHARNFNFPPPKKAKVDGNQNEDIAEQPDGEGVSR